MPVLDFPILYLTILLNLRHKSSTDTGSEKIQTYIISASDLFCLKFRPVRLYSFFMLFYICLLWKFAELDYSEIIKLSVQFKFGAYLTGNIQISIYPYSPEKVQFSSLIFLEHLIFPTRKCLHKAYFTKIIHLTVQINLDKKLHVPWRLCRLKKWLNVTFEGEGKSEAIASRQELNEVKYINGENSRLEGFEPPTFWFVAKHSIQLSYRRKYLIFNFPCQLDRVKFFLLFEFCFQQNIKRPTEQESANIKFSNFPCQLL